jgi:NitT/TauT family transport system substrate-binding protein
MGIDHCRWLGLLVGTAMGISGCHKAAPAPESGQTPVTIVLNWKPEPEFGGIYAAQLDGAFKRHGLDVTIMAGGPGVPTKQILLKGDAQFGVLAADEVLMSRQEGADLVAFFATYQTNPQGIMTHASKGFKSLDDVLRSPVTLAVEPGLHYFDYLKKQVGSGFRAKAVVYSGSLQPYFADANYAQQCFITSEPITAKRHGSDPKVFLIAESGYDPYAGLIVTTHTYLKDHQKTVRAMADALLEGWTDYLKNPQPANEAMHKQNNEMDLEAFAAAAAAQKPLIEGDSPSQLGTMSKERWEALAKQLVDLKVLNTMPDVNEAFLLPLVKPDGAHSVPGN